MNREFSLFAYSPPTLLGLAKLIFLTFDNLGQFLAAQSDEPSPNTLTFEEAPEEYIRTEPPKKATEPTLAENMIGDGIVPPDADMIWPEIEVKDDLGMETKEEKPVKIVNSNIISASINNKTGVTHLEEPITYTLAHKTVSIRGRLQPINIDDQLAMFLSWIVIKEHDILYANFLIEFWSILRTVWLFLHEPYALCDYYFILFQTDNVFNPSCSFWDYSGR